MIKDCTQDGASVVDGLGWWRFANWMQPRKMGVASTTIPARTAPAGTALSLSAGVFLPFSRTNFVRVHQNPAAGFIDFSARFWPGLRFRQQQPLVAETVEWLLLLHWSAISASLSRSLSYALSNSAGQFCILFHQLPRRYHN